MRIVFMGTPEIAETCLARLLADGKNVVGVVTGEDKMRGRGRVLSPTPVKALAEANGIPTLTPKSLRGEEFLAELKALAPDAIAVVAYGKILPPEVIRYPKLGCFNVHVSLLPKYRGAAPMQRAIMNGDAETGVTVMYMDEGLDTGDIVTSVSFPISKVDDFEAVHDRSAEIGARLLSEVLDGAERGELTRTPQDASLASYAQKIEKAEAHVDLSLPAERLDCIIRGLTPIPGAFVYHNGKMLKIVRATPAAGSGRVGEVIALDPNGDGGITVACGTGALTITRLIPEGKGKMSAGDYVRGRKISKGDLFK